MNNLKIVKRSCGVLIYDTNKVLLQLRDNIPTIASPGMWATPGGGVEPNETYKQGAIRELKEETNYSTTEIFQFFKSIYFTDDNKLGEVAYFFGSYDGKQKIQCLEGQKMEFVNVNKVKGIKHKLFNPRLEQIIYQGHNVYKHTFLN